jgi:hypothetical protein
MDALGLTLPIATVISVIVSVFVLAYRISTTVSIVKALKEKVEGMENKMSGIPYIQEYGERLDAHDKAIEELKKIIQLDQIGQAAWRATSSTNQETMKKDIAEMKDSLNRFIERALQPFKDNREQR